MSSTPATTNDNTMRPKKRPAVGITELGAQGPILDPLNWPSASFLQEHLGDDGTSWQTRARLALLQKYGFWPGGGSIEKMTLQDETVVSIQSVWEQVAKRRNREDKTQEFHVDLQSTTSTTSNDLLDFLGSSKSNNRPLQWALMNCPPACQFQLHAHPNIELVYCLEGELHEIRMDSDPIAPSTYETTSSTANDGTKQLRVRASHSIPNWRQKEWKFGTLNAGSWLVNEVGSVHKSFTSTNGQGCRLLVLWGGSHANMDEEPELVVNAVNQMDAVICSCRDSGENWKDVSEMFLPESEKRNEKREM